MGKTEAAGDHVDSDYSGRPLGPLTREELMAAPPVPMTSAVTTYLPDGRRAYAGPGGKWYHEHIVDGQRVWDRPVNRKDYEDKEGQ